jgi:hypothetical protein
MLTLPCDLAGAEAGNWSAIAEPAGAPGDAYFGSFENHRMHLHEQTKLWLGLNSFLCGTSMSNADRASCGGLVAEAVSGGTSVAPRNLARVPTLNARELPRFQRAKLNFVVAERERAKPLRLITNWMLRVTAHDEEQSMIRFGKYRDLFPNARLTRSQTGVLELALHTDGGT